MLSKKQRLKAYCSGYEQGKFDAKMNQYIKENPPEKPDTEPDSQGEELEGMVWQALFNGREALKFNKGEGAQDTLADLAKEIVQLLQSRMAEAERQQGGCGHPGKPMC